MRRSIPPLNPLHVFEVVTRLRSFTKAAQHLNVTQSAVSRQVAALESFLNVRLFNRERHGIELTPAGEAYREKIAPAFATIAEATADLQRHRTGEPLNVRVYTIFAVKWLLRRLPHFEALYPNVSVQVTTSLAAVDFSRERVDLTIRLCKSSNPGLKQKLIFPDVIQPVCSPKLLKGRAPPTTIDELFAYRLVQSHYRIADWTDWLAANGRDDIIDIDGPIYDSSVLSFQAAVDGIGVAIGQTRLLEQDFADRTLLPLLQPVTRDGGYYAEWPLNRELDFRGRAFLAWIEEQGRMSRN